MERKICINVTFHGKRTKKCASIQRGMNQSAVLPCFSVVPFSGVSSWDFGYIYVVN